MKIIIYLSFFAAAFLSFFSELYAQSTKSIELETRILDFDPQSGMKSRQLVLVDFSNKTISSTVETGTTDFFGIQLPSVRDKFQVNDIIFLENEKVTFTVIGETGSGVGIIPNINYKFKVELIESGSTSLKGCHDGYPAYRISLAGVLIYNFEHKSKEILNLFGECDVTVNQ